MKFKHILLCTILGYFTCFQITAFAQIKPEQSQALQEQAVQAHEEQIDSKPAENKQLENPLVETANFQYEAPVYSKVEEVGNDWIIWIKWLIFFVIVSFTLTPILLISATSQNAGIYLAAGAIVGAADSNSGNSAKDAVDGAKNAAIAYLLLLLIGPYGVFYCLYHPLLAFISEADKTYCCTMTWLGDDTIAYKAISADGHWLAEIKETSNNFLGLGDRELPAKYSLSVTDLTTGKHVKWPQTGRKLLGVDTGNSQVDNIAIGEKILIKPVLYAAHHGDIWYEVNLGSDFLQPVNSDRTPKVEPHYSLLDTNGQQVQLQNLANEEVVTIQSGIPYNRSYLSYDGRVLALVYAHPEENIPAGEGVISNLIRLADDAFLGRWKIEFWNVAAGEKIATYRGYGFNKDAWMIDPHSIGRTDFLESSADGRFWYMCRSDGFIHVFDMSKHIPLTSNVDG